MTEPARSFVATPVERRVVVAPGVALHVEQRRGDRAAAPFVLVHGLASNARLWDGVAEHLHASGHTVIAIDQRGHGRSDAPETGYDLDTAVADLLALIGALELERPVLAGQSWGGTVVLELAWRRPDAVRGVACVDALGDTEDPGALAPGRRRGRGADRGQTSRGGAGARGRRQAALDLVLARPPRPPSGVPGAGRRPARRGCSRGILRMSSRPPRLPAIMGAGETPPPLGTPHRE